MNITLCFLRFQVRGVKHGRGGRGNWLEGKWQQLRPLKPVGGFKLWSVEQEKLTEPPDVSTAAPEVTKPILTTRGAPSLHSRSSALLTSAHSVLSPLSGDHEPCFSLLCDIQVYFFSRGGFSLPDHAVASPLLDLGLLQPLFSTEA